MTSDDEVTYERRGRGAWVRLNRPSALNSLDDAVINQLGRHLDRAESDPEVRAVVLTGTGRAFCAGADLASMLADDGRDLPDRLADFLHRTGEVLSRVERFPKPVVAAVNGLALGGGLELVLCCDLAIAARSAALGDAHANYGLLPGGGSSIRLPRRLGITRAKYLLFTAESLTADEAERIGLVNRVVDDNELEQAAEELVEVLAAKSPLGLRRMKALANDSFDTPIDVHLEHELELCELHAHSADFREGLEAFAARRAPTFPDR